jgi:3-hydroxy-3-methylglutaryl CoA synthase
MSHSEHDTVVDGHYKKRCYCQKCTKQYDEWCRQKKREGCQHCKRICKTVCTVECKKPIKIVKEWGYKEEFEGKWEPHQGKPCPKDCKECKKHEHH